ncbi:hypothetical protein AGMMS49982_01470 [Bacteroidia bacterium]|nr:hypothetical protein AGMMS49982_01470 [Bacteroidia bacterium]
MCTEKEPDSSTATTGSIYGIVSDKNGELLPAVGVQIVQGSRNPVPQNQDTYYFDDWWTDADFINEGRKTITGSDGRYEFLDVKAGTYTLLATKTGYVDFVMKMDMETYKNIISNVHEIEVKDGEASEENVFLIDTYNKDKLKFLDNNGNEITSIRISKNTSSTSFQIFNAGNETMSYSIMHADGGIKGVNKSSGRIKPGEVDMIIVSFDTDFFSRSSSYNNTIWVFALGNNVGIKIWY